MALGDRNNDLFRNYVNIFLKVKIEASGWHSDCIDEDSKRGYIQWIKQAEGVCGCVWREGVCECVCYYNTSLIYLCISLIIIIVMINLSG